MNDLYSVSRAGGPPELVLRDAAFFDVSSDGKSLALWRQSTTSDGVRASVWISSPVGARPREYTPAPFAQKADIHPVWLRFSPNGNLLYLSMYTLSSTVETWLLPLPASDGSPRRIFGKVPWQRPVEASWMPDNRHVVLSAAIAPNNSPALWLADTRDESLTRLTDGSSQQREPAVSPDGRRLLFTRIEEDADIVELPLDGSAPRNLLATSASEYSPAWSPKGGSFAYLTRRNGSEEMWLRSSQGDWERPVATAKEFPGLGGLVSPAISPDGSRIVYWTFLRDPGPDCLARRCRWRPSHRVLDLFARSRPASWVGVHFSHRRRHAHLDSRGGYAFLVAGRWVHHFSLEQAPAARARDVARGIQPDAVRNPEHLLHDSSGVGPFRGVDRLWDCSGNHAGFAGRESAAHTAKSRSRGTRVVG